MMIQFGNSEAESNNTKALWILIHFFARNDDVLGEMTLLLGVHITNPAPNY